MTHCLSSMNGMIFVLNIITDINAPDGQLVVKGPEVGLTIQV